MARGNHKRSDSLWQAWFLIVRASLFDAFDDMMDLTTPLSSKAFPIDVEDKGDGYEVKAYFTGVSKDDIDVELNEGRLSISVNVEDKEEDKDKNFLQKEFVSYSAVSILRTLRARAFLQSMLTAF